MAIYQDLVDHHGFTHAYNSVKRFCRSLRAREPEQFDRLAFLNRPGFRGGCLVKVNWHIRVVQRAAGSSLPQPRLVVYSRWVPVGAHG